MKGMVISMSIVPNNRFLGFDRVTLDPKKIKRDDDEELVIESVLASEIVHKYDDGMAYKPADELEKACWTLEGRWIKQFDHPETGTIQRARDISGRMDNIHSVKNLIDPKTKRPCRKGILGDIHFFRNNNGKPGVTPLDDATAEKIRIGKMLDVSVGFIYQKDETPGIFEGDNYDYVQRNFFFDHVAAPVEAGRCPSPYCGLGMDQVVQLVAGDPYKSISELPDAVKVLPEAAQQMFLSVVNNALKEYDGDEEKAFATAWAAVKKKWEKNSEGKWVKKDESDAADALAVDEAQAKIEGVDNAKEPCPLCDEIKKIGAKRFTARMSRIWGEDALKALNEPPDDQVVSHLPDSQKGIVQGQSPEAIDEEKQDALGRAFETGNVNEILKTGDNIMETWAKLHGKPKWVHII